ncbi:hypothetical protein M5X11_12160 [Paenibacillus alginolyticus]|uniref:hypothetical protein n=1 Tax=Paenibacillus alginolyticus TaxID=59839 RepID=UPI0003FABEA2|nr:hypothetical protein [Paenibacillus alginolyticus]MCY9665709.1 hypothetical protein [Paenibacillus alginolyticus]
MAEQKIDKDNFEDIVALTPVQEGMLFHNLTEPDSKQYMEQLTLSFEGKMDEGIFRKLAQQTVLVRLFGGLSDDNGLADTIGFAKRDKEAGWLDKVSSSILPLR